MTTPKSVPLSELDGSRLPFVSVILPILNEENFLEDAISSIFSQDYLGKLEIVLAVAPSKDRTREIADELKRQNPTVVVVAC